MRNKLLTRGRYLPILLAAGVVATAGGIGKLLASDHQDTPEVELNPRMDINDVYVFPGSAADRIVLAVTTSSPIAGQNASFDPNLLYQIKIDNTGDAVEDLVFQITFNGGTGATQRSGRTSALLRECRCSLGFALILSSSTSSSSSRFCPTVVHRPARCRLP